MKPDHKAAKKWAKRMLTPEGLTEEEINLSRAYLDAMAQLDKATELLEEVDAYWGATRPALAERIRDFLDERK